MIPTKLHGVLDYLVAIILIAMPWLLGIHNNNAATLVFVIGGVTTILYSLYTDYECGAWPLIPMRTHLVLDCIQAITIAVSPWLFNFADDIFYPYLAAGILELIVVSLSKSKPVFRQNRTYYTRRYSGKEY